MTAREDDLEMKTWTNGMGECVRKAAYDVSETTVVGYERLHPDWRARLATLLIERWGIVAGDVDGEDSAGRSKLRLLTTDELVTRACDTAGAAIMEFQKRGWVVELPPYAELVEQTRSSNR